MKSYILGSCYSLECSLCRLTSSPRFLWWAWSTNILTCFHTSNTQGQGNGDLVGRSWREAYQEVNNLRIVCDNAITFNVHFLSFLIFSGWGWWKVLQVIQSNLTIHWIKNISLSNISIFIFHQTTKVMVLMIWNSFQFKVTFWRYYCNFIIKYSISTNFRGFYCWQNLWN